MHYKDGAEAKVGDLVKGTTYNTPKGSIHVGILLGITPGSTACNARVLIPVVDQLGANQFPIPNHAHPHPYITEVRTSDSMRTVHREGFSYADGVQTAASVVLAGHKVDYTACGDLELVHRPAAETSEG